MWSHDRSAIKKKMFEGKAWIRSAFIVMLCFVITFGGYSLQLREVQFGVKVCEAMVSADLDVV